MQATVDLEALKTRRDFLSERAEALRAEGAAATEKEGKALAALDAAQIDLREGTVSVEMTTNLIHEVDQARVLREQLARALQEVEREHGEVTAAIAAEEHRIEVERQQREAAPLIAEIKACEAAFVANVAALREPLREAHEVAAQVRREFPLVAVPGPPSLEVLGGRIAERWKGEERAKNAPASAWGFWLAAVVAGPIRSAADIAGLEVSHHLKE